MGLVRAINDDGHFRSELSNAGMKLVVVDFTATWYTFFVYVQIMLYETQIDPRAIEEIICREN